MVFESPRLLLTLTDEEDGWRFMSSELDLYGSKFGPNKVNLNKDRSESYSLYGPILKAGGGSPCSMVYLLLALPIRFEAEQKYTSRR